MLNRRILRTKAFKVIFSYAENPGMTLKEAEAALEISCESTRDLYLFLLSVIPALTQEARSRIEAAMSKFNPSEEERNPNFKFVENRFAKIFAEDPDFNKLISRKKLSWEQYDALLRSLYETVRARKYFQDYMASQESSLQEDAALWARIFEREFEDNADLQAILEEMSIYWNDDLGFALSWCCRTMRTMGEGKVWNMLPLYQSELGGKEAFESDKRFIVNVLRSAYAGFNTFADEVAALTPKWNRDRICTTDLVLIICGMAEAKANPLTPVKVIINEYVEISKSYSTPVSSGFVNGLLDKLLNKHE